MNDVVMWPVDALRDGAHRLLGPFSCLSTESPSPLLRGPQTNEDGNTDLPSTSQTLPLKVVPCLLHSTAVSVPHWRFRPCSSHPALHARTWIADTTVTIVTCDSYECSSQADATQGRW